MKFLVLVIAGLLAGCATVPEAVAGATERYHALGTEPFWSVTIAEGRMAYDAPDGPRFSVPVPPARTTFNGRRYETPRLTLDITQGLCSDGMSDRRYAETVMVIVDGREMRGCGGAILPPAALADTHWAIVAIDGEVVRGDNYVLGFTADRMNGRAGCNRFSAGYSVSGDTLTPGPIAATRMACLVLGTEHESRAFRVLGGPVRISYPDGDSLVLTGNGGSIRLRRSI